jgi:hypothetical protein
VGAYLYKWSLYVVFVSTRVMKAAVRLHRHSPHEAHSNRSWRVSFRYCDLNPDKRFASCEKDQQPLN